MPDEVEALVRDGRYAEAAAVLRRRGELPRAQALLEKIWDFRGAAEIARERGDRPTLLRLLLDGKAFAEAARVGLELQTAAPGEQTRAAEVYEKRRMWSEAAALRERLGELPRARELYHKAQLPLEAARLDEARGLLREAGLAYEKFLAAEPDAPEAPRAHHQLGRILGGFGRHEEAARHLQKASSRGDAAVREKSQRALVVELAAIGYRQAASTVLERLRAADARLPPLEAFLEAERRMPTQARERLAGRYRVERLLGSGGMGRVYLAHDELTGRDVAVKVVAPPVDERLREGYRRFVREARVVSALAHPRIVSVVEFHEEAGLLSMELMAGGTLADRLPGPLPLSSVRAIVLQLLDALEAAHAHGVIHRDLKPANVFFTSAGEAKLGDFGVAHLSDLGATQTAGFIGTLAYMSPEQISGAPLTFACDLYALGVTTYQILAGRLPFRGPDFVGQHLGETPPAPSEVRQNAAGWDPLVARMLAKDPRARFASIDELKQRVASLPVEIELSPSLAPVVAAAPPPPTQDATVDRYVIGGELFKTAFSTLFHATDARLGREVIVERFDVEIDEAQRKWLRAMARHGGPGLQRVLRLEARRAIYEAVPGRADLLPPPDRTIGRGATPRTRIQAIARALQPLHEAGLAHGSIATSIVVDEIGPTLLVMGRAQNGATVEDDQAALASLEERL